MQTSQTQLEASVQCVQSTRGFERVNNERRSNLEGWSKWFSPPQSSAPWPWPTPASPCPTRRQNRRPNRRPNGAASARPCTGPCAAATAGRTPAAAWQTATADRYEGEKQTKRMKGSFKYNVHAEGGLRSTGWFICSETWVGLTLIWAFHHLAQLLLPNSHQPKQNWADSGTTKIKVNPTQSK